MRAFLLLLFLQTVSFTFSLLGADPAVATESRKPEAYLMLTEPKVMRSSISKEFAGAQCTVFTPAKQSADARSLKTYTPGEFAKLGISWETFMEKAQATAERRLAAMKPDFVKNAAGEIVYAVFRSDDPSIVCLLVAPSLGKIFTNIFGDCVWIVTPDRNSLYVFPGKAEAMEEFAADLKKRFDLAAYAASAEIFELKGDGKGLRAVGSVSKH